MASIAPTEGDEAFDVEAPAVTKAPVGEKAVQKAVPIEGPIDGTAMQPFAPVVGDPFSKAAIKGYQDSLPDSVQGFCDSIFYNDIVVERSIQDDLLPGEQILADYNCFVPARGIQMWKFVLYTILTCGMFALYYYFERCMVKNKCWGRKFITMYRGRLCVTSKGRCLVWHSNAEQKLVKASKFEKYMKCLFGCCFRDLLAPPVDYISLTTAKAFRVDQVRDVKMAVGQQMPFLCNICCCSEMYTGSVRVHFDLFSTDYNDMQTLSSVGGGASFFEKAKKLFTRGFVESSMLGGVFTPQSDGDSDLSYVEIKSFRQNDAYMDRNHKSAEEAYADMMAIQREFTTFISKGTMQTWLSPNAENFLDGVKLMPPHELKGEAKMGDLDIIKEHSCAVPQEMITLAPGEEVITTSSDMYILTFMDKVKACCGVFNFGLAALFALFVPPCAVYGAACAKILLDLRQKRACRTGLILTTHRIIEIVNERDDSVFSMCM